jgi:hypothetical protein
MQCCLIRVITPSSRLQSNRHTHTLAPTAWSISRTFACQLVSSCARSDSNQHTSSVQSYPHTIIITVFYYYFCFPLRLSQILAFLERIFKPRLMSRRSSRCLPAKTVRVTLSTLPFNTIKNKHSSSKHGKPKNSFSLSFPPFYSQCSHSRQ